MIDKINKLLDSKDLDNILVAIQLAYTLPIEDFEEILYDERSTGYGGNKWWSMGPRAMIIRKYGLSNYNFVDITPENK